MCTGSVPFPATTVTAQLLAIVSDEPIPVRSANPAIPEPLAALTGRLLAKNAADRPPSAVAVADELQRIELQLSGSTVPSSSIPVLIHSDSLSSVPHASRLARRSTTLALLAVVVVLVATLIALLAIRLPGAKPPVDQPTPANVPKPPSDRPAEAPSLTPVAPVAEVTREPVFLTDIKPSTTVNWPHREGEKSPRPLPAVVVDRKPSPHGLFMYACHPDTHPISVSYALDGKYRRFDTDVAVNDSAHASSGVWSPLTFVVTGDGKVLWESSPTMSVGKPQACSLDVTDVRVLTLQVTTPVVLGGNHGAWVEPRLTR
jgi:serine/threonine protein kinase